MGHLNHRLLRPTLVATVIGTLLTSAGAVASTSPLSQVQTQSSWFTNGQQEVIDKAEQTHNTAKAWISVLGASYILFQLRPHYANFSKRLIKSPKLYFYDTGLLCHLLGIKSVSALKKHSAYGFIFENWMITEIKKNSFNNGLNEFMYYFRDNIGNEVDLILEREEYPLAIEIKAALKLNSNMLRGLNFWQRK